MEFNCETLISCLKAARLQEIVHAPILDDNHEFKVICMNVTDCLDAIEHEINTLKEYKKMNWQIDILRDEINYLNNKKRELECIIKDIENNIKNKEIELKNTHDDLVDFLKKRGFDNVEELKNFFEEYDRKETDEMNKALDEYYRTPLFKDDRW